MSEYKKVKEWHDVFDPVDHKGPHALDEEQSFYRSSFMVEEIMEYLSASRDEEALLHSAQCLKEAIDQSVEKIINKNKKQEAVVDQADALIDLLYFVYGTFVKMEVNPEKIFSIVHEANMAKKFPDGKPHYDKITGKVLKPEGWEENFAPEEKIKKEIQDQREKFDG